MTHSTAESRSSERASTVLLSWLRTALAEILLTGWRGFAWTALGTGVGIAIALLLPPEFTSSATFVAMAQRNEIIPSGLQGIASTIGLTTNNDFSPRFYADLLTSRPVLSAAIRQRYRLPAISGSEPMTYLEVEGIDDADSALAFEAGLKRMAKHVRTSVDTRTNLITLWVTSRYPSLSRDIANRLLGAVDTLNIRFLREHSRNLRLFYQDRVTEVQAVLDAAEDSLRRFTERNRSIANSPLLTFEQLRLQRSVDIRRSEFLAVIQQYEQARAQESRSVPVVTVLAHPNIPAKKSGPPRRLIVVVGALLGFGCLWLQRGLSRGLLLFRQEHPDAWERLRRRREPRTSKSD